MFKKLNFRFILVSFYGISYFGKLEDFFENKVVFNFGGLKMGENSRVYEGEEILVDLYC